MRDEDRLSKAIAQYLNTQYPKVIYHFDLSSGAKTTIGMAMRNKALNKWRGYPDLFVCHPSGNFAGMFIEIKKEGAKVYLKDGATIVSDKHIHEQNEMLKMLREAGYFATFGVGFDNIKTIIDRYMMLNNFNNKPRKKVYQFDEDAKLIKEYEDTASAAIDNKCSYFAINNSCRKGVITGGKYYSYENVFTKKLKTF